MWCLSTSTNLPFKLLDDGEKYTKIKPKGLDIRPKIATEYLPLALIQEIARPIVGVNICNYFSTSMQTRRKVP
jgi:hypothetical protein